MSSPGRQRDFLDGVHIDHRPRISRLSDRIYGEVREIDCVVQDTIYKGRFHFLEPLLAIFLTIKEVFPNARLNRLLVSATEYAPPPNTVQNNAQAAIWALLLPKTDVVILRPGDVITLANTLAISCRHRRSTLNQFLEPYQGLCRHWFPACRKEVFDIVSAGAAVGGRKQALYIRSQPPRTFDPAEEAQLLAVIEQRFELMVISAQELSWSDQSNLARNARLIVGVHGSGLTNLVWLPPDGAVMEFFPDTAHHFDYQMLAEVSHHRYYGFTRGQLRREFSRDAGPFGFGGVIESQVGLPAIQRITEVLDTIVAALDNTEILSPAVASLIPLPAGVPIEEALTIVSDGPLRSPARVAIELQTADLSAAVVRHLADRFILANAHAMPRHAGSAEALPIMTSDELDWRFDLDIIVVSTIKTLVDHFGENNRCAAHWVIITSLDIDGLERYRANISNIATRVFVLNYCLLFWSNKI